MPYTITVLNDSPQALAYVKEAETLDFVKVTKIKETKKKTTIKAKATSAPSEPIFSQEVLEAAEKLKMTPTEMVEEAKKYHMSADDYAFTMVLSKKINHNITQRMCKDFDMPYNN